MKILAVGGEMLGVEVGESVEMGFVVLVEAKRIYVERVLDAICLCLVMCV